MGRVNRRINRCGYTVKEFVLTADYFQNEHTSFVTKVYVKEVERPQIFEYFSLADLFRYIKNARITVYGLKYFARFLFDYFEKSGKHFGDGYNTLIGADGNVFSVYVDGLQFVSYTLRTNLPEDLETLIFDNIADIPSLLQSHTERLNDMSAAIETMFNLNLKKATFNGNIRKGFCEGDARRRAYLFPPLSSYEFEVCTNSYKGGRAYISPQLSGETLRMPVEELDIISAYPYYMRDFPMPYAAPERFEGKYTADKRKPFYIQKLRAEIKIKKGAVPSLLLKDHPIYGKTRYITDTDGLCATFAVTNVELENMLDYYEFTRVEYLGGYKFRAARGLFDEYLAKWYPIKQNNEKGSLKRHFAKHMLDNLGGVLGTRDAFQNFAPYLDKDGIIQLRKLPLSEGHNVYCPAIAFTTGRLRNSVNDIIQNGNVIYTATDSFHVFQDDAATKSLIKSIFPEGVDMGNIDTVRTYDCARYMGQNFYIAHVQNSDTMRVVAAGVPRKYQQSIANMQPGMSICVPGFVSIRPHHGGAYLKKLSQVYKF